MAIRIIDGVPGTGKTYYAVKHLLDKYFDYDKSIEDYVPKKPVTLISNIDDLALDHISLKEEMNAAGGVVEFFKEEYQEQYRHKFESQIVYVIDEAQKLFRKGDRALTPIFGYFEYHRHFGQDIYLITQNSRKIATDIVDLVEYVVRATPRIRSMVGELKYRWISDGERLKTEAFKPDQRVFNCYKSMDAAESEKIKNPIIKTVVIALCLAFVLGTFMVTRLYSTFFVQEELVTEKAEEKAPVKDTKIQDGLYSYVVESGIKKYSNVKR
jgi:zona occludens toxin